MKFSTAITLAVLAAVAAGRAILEPYRSVTGNTSILLSAIHLRELPSFNATVNVSAAVLASAPSTLNDPPDDELGLDSDSDDDGDDDDNDSALTPEQKEQLWCKAKSRGVQLTKAMMLGDAEASTLLQWPYTASPWDGTLKTELQTWGYKETGPEDEYVDAQCDFDKTHEVGDAFSAIGVDPNPSGKGGPNHCFYLEHMNGPNVLRDEDGEMPFEEDQYYVVGGKKYRVTQGYAKIGVNSVDGLVYFIHRQSPEDAAQEHWGRRPDRDELPALRASSDIAWGMWNRVAGGSTKLNYFMAVQIVNPETQYIMERALEQFNVEKIPPWPGKDFVFSLKGKDAQGNPDDSNLLEMEAALALLGSANGLAAGYFLIQHRRRLGWKYIWKVKIWMAGSGIWANPNILFYVSDRAVFQDPDTMNKQLDRLHIAQQRKRALDTAQSGVVHDSGDSRNFIREHVVMAML